MKERAMMRQGTSRRDFLKGVAIGSASVALAGIQPARAGAVPADKRYLSVSPSEMNSLDPADHMDVGRAPGRLNFFDGLLRWRDNPPKLHPWVAESYEGGADCKTWRFKIRQGIKFHDGSDLTADEVIYSVERLLGLGTGAGGVLKPLVAPGSTKAPDKHTVEFHLKKGFAPFPGLTHFLHILNPRVLKRYEKDGDWGNKWLAKNGS
ncbi:MAG TPA: ABC transporter substrate-binding protein, partial [Candidatus Sulfotelmatobacter sp.]|nr:ABC transporter substrate-binding protein [Candidatus Sulfotelmatobacter sp.]